MKWMRTEVRRVIQYTIACDITIIKVSLFVADLQPIVDLEVGQDSHLANANTILARDDIEKGQKLKLLETVKEQCRSDLAKQQSKVAKMQTDYQEIKDMYETLSTNLNKERTKKKTCQQTVQVFQKIGVKKVSPLDVVNFFKSCNKFLEGVHISPGK